MCLLNEENPLFIDLPPVFSIHSALKMVIFVGKINDFNWKEESYDLVVLLKVSQYQSVDFYKLCLMSIGPVVGEIWGEESLQCWEWRFLGGNGLH